jgi:hypothetical protein
MITCGIHSTEVGSTLSSMLIAHRLATVSHPDIKKILDNTIILLVPSLNPDGVDIVKNWYDKTLGTPYEGTEPPELYHKYVGHDNNRDWYAFTQVETQLTVDKIHNVWHPQIVHDVHQQGANGARLFLPPYMAPVEPNVPKQIVEGYTELGNAMAADLRAKNFQVRILVILHGDALAIDGRLLGGGLVALVIDQEVVAEAGQFEGDPPADASRSARDQSHWIHVGADYGCAGGQQERIRSSGTLTACPASLFSPACVKSPCRWARAAIPFELARSSCRSWGHNAPA